MNACSVRILRAGRERDRMFGSNRHERRAEQRVRARRENLQRAVGCPSAPACPARTGKLISQPSDLPIQLACIVFTRSGQSGSFSRSL